MNVKKIVNIPVLDSRMMLIEEDTLMFSTLNPLVIKPDESQNIEWRITEIAPEDYEAYINSGKLPHKWGGFIHGVKTEIRDL